MRLSLYLAAQLSFGLVRVYGYQAQYCLGKQGPDWSGESGDFVEILDFCVILGPKF